MYSNRQVEEKRFWASSLTFGDIHALIAKAEHSRQVLHDTLEQELEQERDTEQEQERCKINGFLDSMQLLCSALDGYLCSGCLDDDACRESLNSFIYCSVLKTFTREKKLVRALDVDMELRVGELDVSIVIFNSCSCS